MKNILFFLFCILCISQVGGAQPFSGPMGSMPQGMPPMGQMPQFQGMKTGVFNGTLVTKEASGKKTPVVGQTVVILVFQNGQRMLMLNKKTDEKGQFQFKNIFIDPSFSYQIGTMWNQNLYVIPELHLEENQKEKKIEFLIGEGSPYFVSTMEAAQRESSAEDSGSPQGPLGCDAV
ncbi:MAG: hypothetical protein IPJ69_04235 [Deltaproteobacteria bacterium]|nr:MAG: hypothetical protein IPJ69_04235 [Deltaproteobacteria bacterium]